MMNLGKVTEDSTVDILFVTNDGSGGAVAPSDAFEAADITIYRDGSATQKTTTNGITMTSPFDSVVGLHQVSIDLNNDTGDAGFWRAGSNYTVVLNPDETVDSQTVVAVIGTFAIEADPTDEAAEVNLTIYEDYGWIDEDGTLRIPFTTRNANGPVTPDSIAVTVYKDSGTSEKATANGITINTDFDSVTGKHLIIIDTSNDTGDAGFWVEGEFHVDISATIASTLYGVSDLVVTKGVKFRIGEQSAEVTTPTIEDVIPKLEANFTSTAGTTLNLRVHCVDQKGARVDLSTYSTATASVTLTPHGSGVATISESFVIGDINNNGFEKAVSTPGLVADTQYVIEGSVVLDGTTYYLPENSIVVFG